MMKTKDVFVFLKNNFFFKYSKSVKKLMFDFSI